ncbi:MAG: class I adenylate-forming enzyme family protein [Nitrospinales bacterium]
MKTSNPLDEIFTQALLEKRLLTVSGALSPSEVERRLAAWQSFGIQPREAVGICFDNGPDCLLAYIGLARLNAVAIPLPPTIPDAERRRLWENTGCRFKVDKSGISPLSQQQEKPLWPDDIYWVMHSSGSTDRPKAIPLSLSAVKKNAEDVMNTLGLGTDLLHLGSMSQCYTNGLYNSFLLPILTGGKALVGPVASALRLSGFIEMIRSQKPDLLWINPTILNLLRRRALEPDLHGVRALISCTAPLSQEDCIAAENLFGKPVLQSYGLTETLIVSIELPGRKAEEEFSAGVIVGGAQAVTVGEDGILVIHNGAVAPGYASCEGAKITFSFSRGGTNQSFVSEDIGIIDEAGRLTLTGRRSTMINVEGVKISSEQMENVLCGYQGVEDAVVLGVRDEQGAERPVALVQTVEPVDFVALADVCAHSLGSKARPAAVYQIHKIPRTPNGKVDRVNAQTLLEQIRSHITH